MKKEIVLIILFLILINVNVVNAENSEYEILLKSRHFIPEPGISDITKTKIEAIPERAHVLIQLEHIPTNEERKELEIKGIKLLSYIPNKAWFASIPSDKTSEIVSFSNVRSVSEILAEDKVHPQLKQEILLFIQLSQIPII